MATHIIPRWETIQDGVMTVKMVKYLKPFVEFHLSDNKGNHLTFLGKVGGRQPVDNGRVLRVEAINSVYVTISIY